MSDSQIIVGESLGGNPAPGSFDSFIDSSVGLKEITAELGLQESDMQDGDTSVVPDTQDAAPETVAEQPKTEDSPKFDPMAFALHTQQQFTELTAALPGMIAQAVAQSMQGILPKQPDAPPPVNPLDALDPNDPDYHIKRYDLQLQQLADQNRRLQERLDAQDGNAKQQAEQAQAQQQHQQFVSHVNGELNKAVGALFKGWPETPQIAALKEAAASKIDKAWYDSGWQPHGYTEGFKQARALVEQFAAFKNAPPPPATGSAPVQSSRAAATTPGTQQAASYNDFWKQKESTFDQDVNALRTILRGG